MIFFLNLITGIRFLLSKGSLYEKFLGLVQINCGISVLGIFFVFGEVLVIEVIAVLDIVTILILYRFTPGLKWPGARHSQEEAA